jgi:microcin C transport system substrate-binding protein
LHDPQGRLIQIELLLQQENPQRELMPFVRNLKRLGIQVNLRQVDVPQYMERIRRQDFDMMVFKMPQTLTLEKSRHSFGEVRLQMKQIIITMQEYNLL